MPAFISRFLGFFLALSLPACSPIQLYNAVSGGPGGQVQVVRDVSFGALERQKLDIYRPVDAGGSHPVVFFIYGGGWNDGGRGDYRFIGQSLARRGYLTVIADYRLVPEVVFPTFLEDGAAALAWVEDNIAQYGGDMSRLALMGHSAGAYNAVMLATGPGYLDAAGFGGSIDAVVGLSGPYDFYPFDVAASQNAFGQAPDPAMTQPVNLVTTTTPPMLLIHGTKDTTVMPRNTKALAETLRANGVAVEEKYYEGWDHGATVTGLGGLFQSRLLDDVIGYLGTRL